MLAQTEKMSIHIPSADDYDDVYFSSRLGRAYAELFTLCSTLIPLVELIERCEDDTERQAAQMTIKKYLTEIRK